MRDGDRGAPPHFAGRQAEIEDIQALAARSAHKEGQTRVMTGAPGSGKTALLRELEARWKQDGTARPVFLEASAFKDPAQVIKKMFLALDDPAAREFGSVETQTEARHAEGGMNAGLAARAGGSSTHSLQRANLPATFLDAFRELEDGTTPVVLLVDEAQLWGTDQEAGERPISSLLAEAHMNLQRLPLLIVAAGLGDSPEVVAQRGASKLKTEKGPLILGRLSGGRMAEVCGKFFGRYRVAGGEGQRREWIEALISETDGWPRHLTNALRGAAESLIEGEGDLARSSLEAAQAAGKAFRRQYYHDQAKPFQRMPELLAEVFGAMPESDGATSYALRKAISRAYTATPDLANEMDRPGVFSRLLHQGLIQDSGHDRYGCPIPSFRRYVEDFCAERGCPVAAAQSPVAPAPEPGMGMGA